MMERGLCPKKAFFQRKMLLFTVFCVFAFTATVPAPAPLSAQSEASRLRITEIYYDVPGQDEVGEWVEIANLGEQPVDLTDFKLADAATSATREGATRFPDGVMLEPGQAIVVARQAAGFRALFGRDPDYEITDSTPAVPDMQRYLLWGTGDFALANDGDELILLDPENRIIDAVNYGDVETFFHPAVAGVLTGQSIERAPAYCDTDSAADWLPRTAATPGSLTLTGDCRPAPDPTADLELLTIGEIQGRDDVSPYINQEVSFRAIVTGYLSDRNARGVTFYTLFVQEMPGAGDADPGTSDGLALFLGTDPPRFSAGDELLVTGQVTEFFGFSEIDNNGLETTLLSNGNPLPPPEPIDIGRLAEENYRYLETLESMRVSYPPARVVGPTLGICSLTVLPATLSIGRVLGPQTHPLLMPVLHTTDVDCSGFPQLRTGDGLDGLVGPLVYHFDLFKLVQQEPAALEVITTPAMVPPPMATAGPGQISVASFNLGDYFDSERAAGEGETPLLSAAEVALKQDKLVGTIAAHLSCPTLLAVQEVENRALLESLALRLEPACGFSYGIAHLESADARGIDLALMADSRHVAVESVALSQACTLLETNVRDDGVTCDSGESPLFSRPPLVVQLRLFGQHDQPLTIIVNHLKSKREGEEETAPRRLAQAQHVAELVAHMLAQDPEARIVVLGDFNDTPDSATWAALTASGNLADALARLSADDRYSYIFAGVSELLDGILLSPRAMEEMAAADIAHVNADYPAGWADDAQSLFRSSDHDIPLVVLAPPIQPEPTSTAALPTATPTAVATAIATAVPVSTPLMEASPEAAIAPASRLTAMSVFIVGGIVLASVLLLLGVQRFLRRRNRS